MSVQIVLQCGVTRSAEPIGFARRAPRRDPRNTVSGARPCVAELHNALCVCRPPLVGDCVFGDPEFLMRSTGVRIGSRISSPPTTLPVSLFAQFDFRQSKAPSAFLRASHPAPYLSLNAALPLGRLDRTFYLEHSLAPRPVNGAARSIRMRSRVGRSRGVTGRLVAPGLPVLGGSELTGPQREYRSMSNER
jgi:hypothetical protein